MQVERILPFSDYLSTFTGRNAFVDGHRNCFLCELDGKDLVCKKTTGVLLCTVIIIVVMDSIELLSTLYLPRSLRVDNSLFVVSMLGFKTGKWCTP